jgi:membrane protease YdiL (CAAX protease family)
VSARVLQRARGLEGVAWVPVAVAGALLLLRSDLVLRGRASPGTLLALYAGLAVVSLVPVARTRSARVVPWMVAVATGLGAVVVARAASGISMPWPVTTWALPLATAAAVAEEAFFRRLLYDRLERFGAGVAIAVSAVAFAAVHVPLYGVAAFWVDLGAGLLFGWQRWASGTWTAPAATHVAANLLAVLQ